MKALILCWSVLLFLCYVFGDEVLEFTDYKLPTLLINCSDDDHCGDFRMVCSEERKLCVCSRFYDWDEELQQCHLNLSELGIWLNSLKEEKDLRDEMIERANLIFNGLAFAGLLAIFCGLLGGFLCVYCFCFIKPSVHFPGDEEKLCTPKEEDQMKKNIQSGDAGITDAMVDII